MNPRRKHWYWFILLLAAEMVLVHPAHVIIEHSGLLHHHHHDEDHAPGHDDIQDDETCVFCVNLGSMEGSKSGMLNSADQKDVHYSFAKCTHKEGLEQGSSARAPPSFFLI